MALFLDRSVGQAIVIAHTTTIRVVQVGVASIRLKERAKGIRNNITLQHDGTAKFLGAVEITFEKLAGDRVRLQITAPRELTVNREEVEKEEIKRQSNQWKAK